MGIKTKPISTLRIVGTALLGCHVLDVSSAVPTSFSPRVRSSGAAMTAISQRPADPTASMRAGLRDHDRPHAGEVIPERRPQLLNEPGLVLDKSFELPAPFATAVGGG